MISFYNIFFPEFSFPPQSVMSLGEQLGILRTRYRVWSANMHILVLGHRTTSTCIYVLNPESPYSHNMVLIVNKI